MTSPTTVPAPTAPTQQPRLLLIHGYSANGQEFFPWRDALAAKGFDVNMISVGNYVTLNNEVTIKDLGEAFDRALRIVISPRNTDPLDFTWPFDAIVHSTGMLVLRQWLVGDPYPGSDARSRIRRLRHIVGLAPATFGSPQAAQGRSWLGALVKGCKTIGPDFLNAGDQVLLGLELGSEYTWDLSHRDLICADPLYARGPETPYIAVFIGNHGYSGLSALDSDPGTDGTVRWAGCALNTRKVSIDLRRHPRLRDDNGNILMDANNNPLRVLISPWENDRLDVPILPVDGRDHATILKNPDPTVVQEVSDFLTTVNNAIAYDTWLAAAQSHAAPALAVMNAESASGNMGGAGWQQFVLRVRDDHDDGIDDYNLKFFTGPTLYGDDATEVNLIADTYSVDASFRCFYVRLSAAMLTLNTAQGPSQFLWIELIASSGTPTIEYEAYAGTDMTSQRLTANSDPIRLDITSLAQGTDTLFHAFTTTMIEIYLEREPTPLDAVSTLFGIL
ncbi:MAG: hypothetical protein WA414_06395 [Acidobacteriaceae bacterium]